MNNFLNISLIDPRDIQELFENWFIRRVQWKTAELLRNGQVKASYPQWADIRISFFERLFSIDNPDIQESLHDFFEKIEGLYYNWEITSEDLDTIEQKLVNASKIFLFWLWRLYYMGNDFQKEDMIETFINDKEPPLNIYNY